MSVNPRDASSWCSPPRPPSKASSFLEKHGYKVKKEYEAGVSGKVFLVKDKDEDLCIIKEINCRDAKILQEVRKEVEMLKTLSHGYIISYVESFEDEETGFFYIVMEYCAGGDLSKRMKTQKYFFEEEQILDWLVQICLALQYIHEKKVLHRDIKPQNLFLTEEGYINIGDFGCSKVLDRLTRVHSGYMNAPPVEQWVLQLITPDNM
nr:serine/threonine-protein kinase Nek1-like [Danio rerio]|eukprot:XP_021333769.1 serine/threonine-protein kinase Nek1-like [Danio rerio]